MTKTVSIWLIVIILVVGGLLWYNASMEENQSTPDSLTEEVVE